MSLQLSIQGSPSDFRALHTSRKPVCTLIKLSQTRSVSSTFTENPHIPSTSNRGGRHLSCTHQSRSMEAVYQARGRPPRAASASCRAKPRRSSHSSNCRAVSNRQCRIQEGGSWADKEGETRSNHGLSVPLLIARSSTVCLLAHRFWSATRLGQTPDID